MSTFHVDPWEAARLYHDRQMRMFMARLLKHFNVTQVTLPNSTVFSDDAVVVTELLDKDAVHYRIIGKLKLEPSERKEKVKV